VLPAQKSGLRGVLLRGPWGYVNEAHEDADRADVGIASLDELDSALRALL
jgi:hypothetical protein